MAEVRAHFVLHESVLNEQVEGIGVRRMRSLLRRSANQARVDVPVDTGHLGRSIGEGPIRIVRPRVVAGSLHATAEYAAPVHEGRRARIIRPVKAKALRFEIGGRVIYASIVRQGPMRGRPFLRNAAMRTAAREK